MCEERESEKREKMWGERKGEEKVRRKRIWGGRDKLWRERKWGERESMRRDKVRRKSLIIQRSLKINYNLITSHYEVRNHQLSQPFT